MRCTLPTVVRASYFDSRVKIPDLTETKPRVPETYELELFTEDGGIAFLNGTKHPIKKGGVLLAKPGDVRCCQLHIQCKFIYFTTDDPKFIRLAHSLRSVFYPESYERIASLFAAVQEAFVSADEFSALAASSRLAELLWQLHLCGSVDEKTNARDPVTVAIRKIRREFRSDLSVEQLAAECNLSVSYFHKLFVQATGTTPNRYLMMTRLTAAKGMLLSSDQSVAQVAECCGFSSQGYFCDCMKKYLGVSPRQFRRNANYPEDQ